VQYVDGVDGARKAVREQAMYGASWIKYYSDRRYHFESDGVLHSMVNFTMKSKGDRGRGASHRKKVARTPSEVMDRAALRAGVDTIEHGDGLTDALMDEMARRGSTGSRRLPSAYMLRPGRSGNWPKMAELQRE